MKRKVLIALAYGVPALCIASVLAFTILRPIQVLPRVGLGPGFGLTDINGELVTNETMRGRLVLYNFTYTHCQSGCPRLIEKIRQVRERMNEVELDEIEVELVTISIDPERDTVEAMAGYAADYGVGTEAGAGLVPWHFLTGDKPELVKIMVSSGFDLYHEKVPSADGPAGDYQFKFVPMAVLVDGWGIIRAEYRQYEPSERLSFSDGASDIDPDIILRDVGLVAAEAKNSKGAAKAAYGAAHLFLCYPP